MKVRSLEIVDHRRDFLVFCGFKEYIQNLHIDRTASDFIRELINEFLDTYITSKHCRQRALISLLELIIQEQEHNHLINENDLSFIEFIINKPDWASLLEDNSLISLHELIRKLQRLSNAHHFDVNKCKQIIEVFREISVSLKAGYSFSLCLDKYRDKLVIIDYNIEIILKNFYQESEIIKRELGWEVPIILLIMNQIEAQELDSKKAFYYYNNELCDNFQKLKQKLVDNGINNWVNHYQQSPEQWQPFNQTGSHKNIKQLFEEAFSEIHYEQKIVPKFVDIRELNQDSRNNFKLLKKLREQGCIVIIDAISIQHPKIQSLFRSTAIDAFPNTLVVMIAPYSVFDIVQKIESVIEQRIDIDFYRRLQLHDNKCRKVGDNTDFRSWLIDKVPHLLSLPEKDKVSTRPWDNFGKGG